MDVELELEALLANARDALAGLKTLDRTCVAGVVNGVADLRYAEGTLLGFLDALEITNPPVAKFVASKIEGFVGEAIAARVLLD